MSRRLLMLPVGILAATTACSGSPTPAPTPTVASSTAAPTTSPSVSGPSSGRTPTPTPPALSEAVLTRALLSAEDLPSGFTKDAGSDPPAAITVTGQGRACERLADLLETEEVDGSRAGVEVSFVGPAQDDQDAPALDQSLDALFTATAAAKIVDRVAGAVEDCRSLTLTLAGAGSSTLSVEPRTSDELGQDATTVVFRAEDGALAGFEITQILAPVEQVLVQLIVSGLTAGRTDRIAGDAVAKVERQLGSG